MPGESLTPSRNAERRFVLYCVFDEEDRTTLIELLYHQRSFGEQTRGLVGQVFGQVFGQVAGGFGLARLTLGGRKKRKAWEESDP